MYGSRFLLRDLCMFLRIFGAVPRLRFIGRFSRAVTTITGISYWVSLRDFLMLMSVFGSVVKISAFVLTGRQWLPVWLQFPEKLVINGSIWYRSRRSGSAWTFCFHSPCHFFNIINYQNLNSKQNLYFPRNKELFLVSECRKIKI